MSQCVRGSQQRWCVWYLWLGCGWSRPPSLGQGPTASWQTHASKWSSTATARWACTWEAAESLTQASTPAPSPAPAIPSPARHASIWPTVRSTAIPMATPCSGDGRWRSGLQGIKVQICAPDGPLNSSLFSLTWVLSACVVFVSHPIFS